MLPPGVPTQIDGRKQNKGFSRSLCFLVRVVYFLRPSRGVISVSNCFRNYLFLPAVIHWRKLYIKVIIHICCNVFLTEPHPQLHLEVPPRISENFNGFSGCEVWSPRKVVWKDLTTKGGRLTPVNRNCIARSTLSKTNQTLSRTNRTSSNGPDQKYVKHFKNDRLFFNTYVEGPKNV